MQGGIKHSFDVSLLCPHTGHSKENKADVAGVVGEVLVLSHVSGETGLVKGLTKLCGKIAHCGGSSYILTTKFFFLSQQAPRRLPLEEK